MKPSIIVVSFIATIFLLSCNNGFVVVEKSESFKNQKSLLKEKEIIYFQPDITIYDIKEEINNDLFQSEKEKVKLTNSLMKMGAKNNFKVRVLGKEITKNNDHSFIYSLSKLKRSIEKVNVSQNNPLNEGNYSGASKKIQQKVFVTSPRISPEFSALSEKLNSPYFGICGIFSVSAFPQTREARDFMRNNKDVNSGIYFYFYNIITNVETGEIIYREIKKVPLKLKRKNILDIITYDSFFILNENFNK